MEVMKKKEKERKKLNRLDINRHQVKQQWLRRRKSADRVTNPARTNPEAVGFYQSIPSRFRTITRHQ